MASDIDFNSGNCFTVSFSEFQMNMHFFLPVYFTEWSRWIVSRMKSDLGPSSAGMCLSLITSAARVRFTVSACDRVSVAHQK